MQINFYDFDEYIAYYEIYSGESKVTILDEPTSGVDVSARHLIWKVCTYNSGVIKNGTDRYVTNYVPNFYINPVKESQLLRF